MSLKRNRYDPEDLLQQLSEQEPTRDGNEWCFIFRCDKRDPEIEGFYAYLPKEHTNHKAAKELLMSLLQSIERLDDLVQDSCEEEASKSSSSIENFMLHIGYMDLTGEKVRFRYYGTKVNTEWYAEFERNVSGIWQKANF
jgi:hypothetical protein